MLFGLDVAACLTAECAQLRKTEHFMRYAHKLHCLTAPLTRLRRALIIGHELASIRRLAPLHLLIFSYSLTRALIFHKFKR